VLDFELAFDGKLTPSFGGNKNANRNRSAVKAALTIVRAVWFN
jgi:hypothetical protein